jgi:hypothetical protein
MSRLLALLLFASSLPALADSDQPMRPAPTNPTWWRECGACHLAYPPRMLPAASWRNMMADLERHFGTDASLEESQASEIGRFLQANAGRGRGAPPRITETTHFIHEHEELAPAVWARKSVGSRANCQACHRDAEAGRFAEHRLRIPR